MGKIMLIHLCVMLLYIAYKGIFCDELVENYQVDPNIQNPFAKLDLRELVKFLEANQQSEYNKRGDKRTSSPGNDIEPTYETGPESELGLKNLDLLWQAVEDEIKKQGQMRFLSPRLGRNAYPHGLNLPPLPPRIGKRNTIFAPRMGK